MKMLTTFFVICSACLGQADPPPRDAPPPTGAVERPNIILLLSDDQNWNGLSVAMDPDEPRSRNSFVETPNLERLAEEGMCLSTAYAPAPVCAPSRVSIQTGKSPARLNWTKAGPSLRAANGLPLIPPVNGRNMATSEVTIPEVLKNAGYRTAHFGKWHIGGGGPGSHGFDVHDGDTGNEDAEPFVDPNPVDIVGMTDRAKAFIDESLDQEEPFFLQMSYYALHYPGNASKAMVAKYTAKAPGKRQREIQRAAIAEDLDIGVGKLLEHLAERGLEENTVLIYMGDNGASDRDNPLRGGKGGLGEGGVRVPFIIRGPGIEPGSHSDLMVTGMDFLPTFARLAGSDRVFPDEIEGGDFMPALTGDADGVERTLPYVVFHFPHYQGTSRPQSSILMGDLKLVRYYEDGRTELFDLEADPGETTNLAQARPDDAKRLEAALAVYLSRSDAGMPRTNPQADPEATIPNQKPSGREGSGREGRARPGRGRGAQRPGS
jgi:arylsulfatase A